MSYIIFLADNIFSLSFSTPLYNCAHVFYVHFKPFTRKGLKNRHFIFRRASTVSFFATRARQRLRDSTVSYQKYARAYVIGPKRIDTRRTYCRTCRSTNLAFFEYDCIYVYRFASFLSGFFIFFLLLFGRVIIASERRGPVRVSRVLRRHDETRIPIGRRVIARSFVTAK